MVATVYVPCGRHMGIVVVHLGQGQATAPTGNVISIVGAYPCGGIRLRTLEGVPSPPRIEIRVCQNQTD